MLLPDINGNAWTLLGDNQDVDITPRLNEMDFYTFDVRETEYSLIHQTEHVALNDTNRARTFLGVGEEVDFKGMPDITIWNSTAGGLSSELGNAVKFTAPTNNGEDGVTITATVRGINMDIYFTVVPPSGIELAYISGSEGYPTNQCEADMNLWPVLISPTIVSFYRVQIYEVGENASEKTGYFLTNGAISHINHGANHWTQLSESNWFWDSCSLEDLPQPWSSGSFKWNIPVWWKIDGGQTNEMPGWNQLFWLDSSGTITIEKFGLTVSRTTNNIITLH